MDEPNQVPRLSSAIRWDRVRWVVFGCGVMAFGGWWLYQNGPNSRWLPSCWIKHWTGVLCPGCGMTRGVHAALHGHWAQAFRFNPLGMAALPVALGVAGHWACRWVRGLPVAFVVRPLWLGLLGVVVLVFWVLRNLPGWPFTLLAPP